MDVRRPASAAAAAEASSQGGERGGLGCRPPEARIFRLAAKFAVGEGQLRVERRAASGAGKLMEALQPCSAPLVCIAQTRGARRTRPETALDPGMVGQGLGLKPMISGRREPPDDLGVNPVRRPGLETLRCRWRMRGRDHDRRGGDLAGARRQQQRHGDPRRNRGAAAASHFGVGRSDTGNCFPKLGLPGQIIEDACRPAGDRNA